MTASFPSNPIAHESIARYLQTMKSVYLRVAAGRALPVSGDRLPTYAPR